MRTARVVVGRKVRLYDVDDWFFPGRVTSVTNGIARVDYGDWVTDYAVSSMRECYPEDGTYEEVLIPYEIGVIHADYRDAA